MSDDRFDDWIADAARGYNPPPPAVPREEMWTAITAGLEKPGAGTRDAGTGELAHGGRDASDLGARRSALVPRPSNIWRAAAAVALVAAGLAGGYWLRGAAAPSAPVVAAVDAREGASGTLNQVLVEHFTDAEALLVAFQGRKGIVDADAAGLRRWALDALGTTRLLLDSPVASDPSRRRLLEDLELILVQIANLSPRAPADERDLTSEALTREQLLTRLRSTIPAGMVSGT